MADRPATYSFWAFGTILHCSAILAVRFTDILAGCGQIAGVLETVVCRFPSTRLWSVVDDMSTHAAGFPKMVRVVTHNGARSLTDYLNKRNLPPPADKSKVLLDVPDGFRSETLGLLQQGGIGSINLQTYTKPPMRVSQAVGALLGAMGSGRARHLAASKLTRHHEPQARARPRCARKPR